MKVYIPTKQEKETPINAENTEAEDKYISTSSGIISSNENKESTESTKNSKININIATQAQLETLPGIGPSTATKIISYRKEKGKFKTIEDMKEVSGIGDAKFDKIKNLITVK